MTRKAALLGLAAALVVAAGYFYVQHSQPRLPPMQPPAGLQGQAKDNFFTLMASYCKANPSPTNSRSCAMCSQETCPDCGFGPERSQMVAACNTNSWDCAASLLFAPGDGGACSFAPEGPCPCPAPDALRKSETKPARPFAALRQAAAPLSLRPAQQ